MPEKGLIYRIMLQAHGLNPEHVRRGTKAAYKLPTSNHSSFMDEGLKDPAMIFSFLNAKILEETTTTRRQCSS
jgi:hypothetical protein